MTHDILKLVLEFSGSVGAAAIVGSMMFARANGELEKVERDHTKIFYPNQGNK